MKKYTMGMVMIVCVGCLYGAYWLGRQSAQVPQTQTTGTSTTTAVTTSTTTAAAITDFITVTSPLPNSSIHSPLTITGKARGSWFFEASFPIVLTDWDGKIIASGHATAQGDWMTTAFVPFTATLQFTPDAATYSASGTLILKKDNPSGLPEHDAALEIPVQIASSSVPAINPTS